MTAAPKTEKLHVAPECISRDKYMINVFGTPDNQPRQEPATKTSFMFVARAPNQPRQKHISKDIYFAVAPDRLGGWL